MQPVKDWIEEGSRQTVSVHTALDNGCCGKHPAAPDLVRLQEPGGKVGERCEHKDTVWEAQRPSMPDENGPINAVVELREIPEDQTVALMQIVRTLSPQDP
eukprot:9084373-Alexandrium_andersonii.AAC.1